MLNRQLPRAEGTQGKHLTLILILICIALTLLTVVVFLPLKESDFINYDDDEYVYENAHVQQGMSWKSFQWTFSTEAAKIVSNWQPVTWFSLILDHEFFGLNPRGYHLTNLFFHILNVILLFLIFHRMTKTLWKSALIAVLFAIHPLRVESVAWVTERKDVLSTFFWMWAIGSYVLFTERKTFGRYFGTLVFFIIGLMAKPMLVTLPLVLILLDYWPLNRFLTDASVLNKRAKWKQIWRLIWEKLPFFLLSVVFSVVNLIVQREGIAVVSSTPLDLRIENALRSYVVYILKMIWPRNLSVFYPYPETLPVWQILGAVLILAGITAFVFRMRKTSPHLLFGWLWYLCTLLPVIGFIRVGIQPAYADRFTYIPLIGLFIMVAWSIPELLQGYRYRKELLITSSILSLTCFSMMTWIQVSYWQNSIALFNHALKVTTKNSIAYNNRGVAYLASGNYGQAAKDFDKAIEFDSRNARAYGNHGAVCYILGNYSQAIADFNGAIEIKPQFANFYRNRGVAYAALGDVIHAIADFDKTIEYDPRNAEAYSHRGAAHYILGNYRQAIGDFDRAIEINPRYEETYTNRGIAYRRLGNYGRALVDFNRAIEMNRNNANAYYNRGITYASLGNQKQAIEDLKTAAMLGSKDAKYALRSRG